MNRSNSKKVSKAREIVGQINIGTLKAHLAKYLRLVQSGEEVVITDHKRPVARIIPFKANTPLEFLPARIDFKTLVAKIKINPLENKLKIDSLSLLLEERGSR